MSSIRSITKSAGHGLRLAGAAVIDVDLVDVVKTPAKAGASVGKCTSNTFKSAKASVSQSRSNRKAARAQRQAMKEQLTAVMNLFSGVQQ